MKLSGNDVVSRPGVYFMYSGGLKSVGICSGEGGQGGGGGMFEFGREHFSCSPRASKSRCSPFRNPEYGPGLSNRNGTLIWVNCLNGK